MSKGPRLRGFPEQTDDTPRKRPAEEFVPKNPGKNDNVIYGAKLENKSKIGHNVQQDHVPAQAVLKQIVGPDHDPKVLTVVQETGKATPNRPALPHTQATKFDVRQNKGLKEDITAGRQPHTSNIIAASRNARIKAGYTEQSVDRAWVDALGTQHSKYPMDKLGDKLHQVAKEEGRKTEPIGKEVAGLDFDKAFKEHNPNRSASKSADNVSSRPTRGVSAESKQQPETPQHGAPARPTPRRSSRASPAPSTPSRGTPKTR